MSHDFDYIVYVPFRNYAWLVRRRGLVLVLVQCGGSSLASQTLKNVASLTAENDSLTSATRFSVYYTPEAPDLPCPREGE